MKTTKAGGRLVRIALTGALLFGGAAIVSSGVTSPAAAADPVAAAAPGAPTSVNATAVLVANSVITWTAPVSNGGSAITEYDVTDGAGHNCSTTGATTCTVNGLSSGTPYNFIVTAKNIAGASNASVQTPDAPALPTASIRSTFTTISWVAPANGGSIITAYNVTDGGGHSCAPTINTQCDITGLTNGTSYAFTVTALNAVTPVGIPSPPVSVTPATVPGAPTGAAANSGQNTASTVTWTAPVSDGGSAITGYTVTSTPGGLTCTTITTTCTVTGLTNDTGYTFAVTARNAVGIGSASTASNPAIPALSAPDAPTAVTATSFSDSASTVSWTAPVANGGSVVTGYTVTSTPLVATSAACSTGIGGLTGSSVNCVFTGLSNGTPYTFTVTATNAINTGIASAPSSPATPAVVPDAPTAVTATSNENAKSTVSWTAPVVDGGASVTSYAVTATDSTNPAHGNQTATGASSPLVVIGLTNGENYTFTVKATNGAGTGIASAASSSATPAAVVPDAPTTVTATSNDDSASTISWVAPVSDGGSVITGYTVTAVDSTTPANGGQIAPGATSPLIVTGLTNGDSYTFTVTATNVTGTGIASAASSPAIPLAVPGVPTSVTAAGGANSASDVAWTAPVSDGGSIVTGYTVTSAPEGLTCTTATLACTVSGLTNGNRYTFTVTATNTRGTGIASDPSNSALPEANKPDAPTTVNATSGENATSTVTWTAPASDGGSAITGYTVTAAPAETPCVTTGTTCTFPGLTNDTSYIFTVTATNNIGNSSAVSNSATPVANVPGAPTAVNSVSLHNGNSTINWGAPVTDGGSVITNYTVTAAPGANTCSTAGVTTCNIGGLDNSTNYSFTVIATNIVGPGNASVNTPGAPTGAVATKGNAQASVAFIAPATNGGSAITGYTVMAVDSTTPANGGQTVSGATSPLIVTGLTNGDSYTFTVVATNTNGNSAASAASAAVVPIASQTITFTSGNAGSVGTAYTVTANGGASTSPVLFTIDHASTANCTLAGSAASFTSVGVCMVDANQAGSAAFSAAPQVQMSITVTQSNGYDVVGSDGGVFVFGGSGQGFFGSLPGLGIHVNNVVGIVPTIDHKGYFLVGSDGGVFAFGDAPFQNSLPGVGVHVNNIVGIVPTSDNKGYFLVGSDGGVFAFGDAPFENSLPGMGIHVNNVVGIVPTGDNGGYWLVAKNGTVYSFGNAANYGSLTGPTSPLVGIAATADYKGYWLAAANGNVWAYGDAKAYGTLPGLGVNVSNITAIVPSSDGMGYMLIGTDGGVFAFGDASQVGSLPGLGIHVNNIVGAVPTF